VNDPSAVIISIEYIQKQKFDCFDESRNEHAHTSEWNVFVILSVLEFDLKYKTSEI